MRQFSNVTDKINSASILNIQYVIVTKKITAKIYIGICNLLTHYNYLRIVYFNTTLKINEVITFFLKFIFNVWQNKNIGFPIFLFNKRNLSKKYFFTQYIIS